MEWKDYFKLKIFKETLGGSQLYFQSELKIKEDFEIEKLSLEEFDYLNLSDQEKKLLSLSLRKILLRCQYFKSYEFKRIVENFAERIVRENHQLLTFSTQGGGTYLFTGLLLFAPLSLENKKIICYTNELPLKIKGLCPENNSTVHFIPHVPSKTFFGNIPSLCS